MYDIEISCENDKIILERIVYYYRKLKLSKYYYEAIIIVINLYNFLKLNKSFILNNKIFTKKILEFYYEFTYDEKYSNLSPLLKNSFYNSYINLKNIE